MDTSLERINMCAKCSEIQSAWKPMGGDWYVFDYRGTTHLGKDLEKLIWRDKNEVWQQVEILCYQPDEQKNLFISTDGKTSHVTSTKDLVKSRAVWLPLQNQLQDMMIEKNYSTSIYHIIEDFNLFYKNLYYGYICTDNYFNTFDQLWIAFYMRKQHDKVWDKERCMWINYLG